MKSSNDPDTFEGLVDIVSVVPRLLEMVGETAASKTAQPGLFRSLLDVQQKIAEWRRSRRVNSSIPLHWAVPSQLHHPSDDAFEAKLFPFAIEYESLDTAIQFTFSSAIMLEVLMAALILKETTNLSFEDNVGHNELEMSHFLDQEDTNSQSPTVTSLPAGKSLLRHEADGVARFLCQSIEYCFREDMGTLGAQITSLPRWVMKSYFRRMGLTREFEWCTKIEEMSGPGFRTSIPLMLFRSEEYM